MFYQRLLRCFVLIDLKIGRLTHQDPGQMQMYVNFYDRFVKLHEESPTIGILMCRKKNDAVVEITLPPEREHPRPRVRARIAERRRVATKALGMDRGTLRAEIHAAEHDGSATQHQLDLGKIPSRAPLDAHADRAGQTQTVLAREARSAAASAAAPVTGPPPWSCPTAMTESPEGVVGQAGLEPATSTL